MQAGNKANVGTRRRQVHSAAAMAGVAALLELACQSHAGTLFNDTFGTSTVNSATNSPTATSTNYDFLSTKTSVSSIATGDLQGKLSAATGTGAWEAQALFTLSPVTLVNAGDSIEETMVFTPTNIAVGSTSTLLMGLYNSHGAAPTNALGSGGLSNTTGSSSATGNAQLWEGYVGRFAGATGTDQTFVRPQQTGGLTTTQNQDLLVNTTGSGFFNGPGASNVTSAANTGVTLSSTSQYTDDLLLTLNADGSVTVNSTLFSGAGTTGAPLASTTGSVTSASIKTFDGLAFGALNKGTTLNPQLDINSLTITTASAATLTNRTWDPGLTTTGSDGSGNWTTANAIWAASGADGAWVNDGTSSAVIGAGGTAGTITVTDPNINAAGITFNSGYSITANAGSTLTLTAPSVTVATGATATISAPIAGNVGLASNGAGSLVLTGVNTYTGNTSVNNGTVVVNPGSNLGAATNGLVIGTTGTSSGTTNTNTGALILNTSVTVGSLTVGTFNTAANTIAINGSSILTVNGATNIGLSTSATTPPTTALTITGNELDVNNTMNIGLTDTGASKSTTLLDMSGLATFTMNATGTGQAFNFGVAQEAGGTVTLANTSNTITTNTINVSVNGSNAGVDTLNLGAGLNVLNASNILVGSLKGIGTVQFAGPTGSVTIAGITGGSSTANITLGSQTTGTAASGTTALNLVNHLANIQANTLIIGQLAGSANGTPTASVSFNTGTFNVASLQIANDSSGTTATGVNGTFTLGGPTPNNTATGILNVTSQFTLANSTNTGATPNVAHGTFIINGGTANISVDIAVGQAAGATSTTSTTLQLAGGTLNMNGHEIGPVSASNSTIAINSVLLPAAGQSATLANLGGAGINSAGLNMNGGGVLILSGTNTYTGGTSVTSGELDVGAGASITDTNISIGSGATFAVLAGGSLPSTANITGTAGTFTVNSAVSVGSFNVGTVNANANIRVNGTSETAALNLLGGPGAWTTGLDLTTSKLIVEVATSRAAAITQLQNQVAFGKTSTNGIFTSSTLPSNQAIAVMDNAVLNKTIFGGLSVDTSSVLVSAELLGDSNADGHVDLTDLSTVLNNFGATTSAWTSGNFDGATTIDLTDLSDVLNNFGLSNPNAFTSEVSSGTVAASATPEPTTLAIVGLGAVALISRRRRA